MLTAISEKQPESVDAFILTAMVVAVDDGGLILDNGHRCGRAAGCLLEPQVDDTVLCCVAEDGTCYVLQVLCRAATSEGRISVEGAGTTTLSGRRLRVAATDDLTLTSLRNMAVNAGLGNLTVHARNLFSTAADSVVQTANSYVGKVTQYSLTALGLLRQHGRHQVVTADQEVRLDGERITMG